MGPVLTGVVTTIAKPVIERTKNGDLSYPSGHMGSAVAVAVVVSLLLVSVFGARRWVVALAVLVPILWGSAVGLAMTVTYYHYWTDAIGGFCVAVAVVLLVRWIAHSDYGRAISAMRDDEVAFAALGRDAKWMKISIFALGSGIAGFAGALYAHYFRYVTVEQFEILMSSTILTMVVVGGLRSPWGPVVGAVLLQILPQAITFLNLPPVLLGPLQGLLFTGLVLVFMFIRPGGLIQAGTTWTSATHTKASKP